MKTINTEIDGRSYYLLYNAEAMFELDDRLECDNLVEAVVAGGRDGFEATLLAASVMAEQGELARRALGYDAGSFPSIDTLRITLPPAAMATLRRDVIDAICLGMDQTVDRETDVVDLGLAEAEKKTN